MLCPAQEPIQFQCVHSAGINTMVAAAVTVVVLHEHHMQQDVEELQCYCTLARVLWAALSRMAQVQNQLNAFIVLAAALWCVLAGATMVLQEHSTQQAVVVLW